MKPRTKSGLLFIAISVAISSALGALLALMSGSEVLPLVTTLFWYFGAAGCVCGFLMCATKMKDNLCFGFGLTLYYGTIIVSGLLGGILYGPEQNQLFFAFVIVALACYIVWLTRFKDDEA